MDFGGVEENPRNNTRAVLDGCPPDDTEDGNVQAVVISLISYCWKWKSWSTNVI